MASPFFLFRTMKVNCRPCRSRWRPGPWLQRQQKKKRKRKKVNSRDCNVLMYLLGPHFQICCLFSEQSWPFIFSDQWNKVWKAVGAETPGSVLWGRGEVDTFLGTSQVFWARSSCGSPGKFTCTMLNYCKTKCTRVPKQSGAGSLSQSVQFAGVYQSPSRWGL